MLHGSMGSYFSVLSDLKKLEHVKLNAVRSVKFPHKLPPKLNSIAFIGNSYMKSWGFLKNLDELESLMVNPKACTTPITKLKTLKRLVVESGPEVKERPELSIFQSFLRSETLTFQFRGVEKTLTNDDLNKLKSHAVGSGNQGNPRIRLFFKTYCLHGCSNIELGFAIQGDRFY